MTINLCSNHTLVAIQTTSTLDFSKLNTLIADHRTSEILEMLEEYGFAGESGITVLAFLQDLQ